MARKRKELPHLENVEITDIAAEGKAIAKVRLKETDESPIVVFVPYGAPGDVVNLKIDKKKHNYAEAHITDIVTPSPMREAPRCEYFGVCGGCKWQHLPYEEQLRFKRQQVVDALQRIAKVELPEVSPAIGSDKIWEYRNKMEYTFSNKRWRSWEEIRGEKEVDEGTNTVGFHIPGCFDKVLHINRCWLQNSIGDKIRNRLYSKGLSLIEEAKKSGFLDPEEIFYDIRNNKGLLRNIMIRPVTTGELMVCLVFGDDGLTREGTDIKAEICAELCEEFPEITTMVYVVNKKVNDSISDQKVIVYKGPGYIEEKMGDLKFRISAKSFYQTNSLQAEKLYATVAEFAGLTKANSDEAKPMVYDLYTGTGTIANYIAGSASKVIGIEYVEDAIKDARINSEINHITNTEFYAGDMKDVLTEDFLEVHGKPDIIIVDPPRAGMHEDVVKVIMNSEPDIIIYVSCNPATQARDIALMDSKYKVAMVQPVDMFPHTHHIENVVRLERRL